MQRAALSAVIVAALLLRWTRTHCIICIYIGGGSVKLLAIDQHDVFGINTVNFSQYVKVSYFK